MAYPNNMVTELLGRADADVAVRPPLSQAVGYTVVVVIGLVIAFAMVFVTKVLRRTVGEDNRKTEM
jgi:biopolymer transport protein ExbB/TolQ